MFNSILVPIDLADTDLAKPAIATAATLSQTWHGTVRLLNVLPMTPVMLAEYVPADFDAQQRQTSEEALIIVARESGIEPARISSVVRQGGIYHEILEEADRDQGRPDRHDLAPAGDADLFPGLQRRPCRALRQVLGAGGAALIRQLTSRISGVGCCVILNQPIRARSPDPRNIRLGEATDRFFDLAAREPDIAERAIVQFPKLLDRRPAIQIEGERARPAHHPADGTDRTLPRLRIGL